MKKLLLAALLAVPAFALAAPPPPQHEEPPTNVPPPPATLSADDLYNQAISQLASGDPQEARKTLQRVLAADPRYARAHFRMGQIAMFNRNFDPARREYEAAWRDKESLDAHDRHLVRLGMAVVNGNRQEARKVGLEMERLWPGDPDLARVKKEFGGEELPQGRPQRPRWRKP